MMPGLLILHPCNKGICYYISLLNTEELPQWLTVQIWNLHPLIFIYGIKASSHKEMVRYTEAISLATFPRRSGKVSVR